MRLARMRPPSNDTRVSTASVRLPWCTICEEPDEHREGPARRVDERTLPGTHDKAARRGAYLGERERARGRGTCRGDPDHQEQYERPQEARHRARVACSHRASAWRGQARGTSPPRLASLHGERRQRRRRAGGARDAPVGGRAHARSFNGGRRNVRAHPSEGGSVAALRADGVPSADGVDSAREGARARRSGRLHRHRRTPRPWPRCAAASSCSTSGRRRASTACTCWRRSRRSSSSSATTCRDRGPLAEVPARARATRPSSVRSSASGSTTPSSTTPTGGPGRPMPFRPGRRWCSSIPRATSHTQVSGEGHGRPISRRRSRRCSRRTAAKGTLVRGPLPVRAARRCRRAPACASPARSPRPRAGSDGGRRHGHNRIVLLDGAGSAARRDRHRRADAAGRLVRRRGAARPAGRLVLAWLPVDRRHRQPPPPPRRPRRARAADRRRSVALTAGTSRRTPTTSS